MLNLGVYRRIDLLLMKRFIIAFACLLCFSHAVTAQSKTKKGETENFRRSSLCLLLITSQGDEFAKAIEEQFMAMPMPARYNGLNTDVRVLNISKKATEKRITKALQDNEVAKQLVAKWFDRDYQGRMDMKRIHDWGGYNATFADLKRAESTVRGTAMLTDEGEELLKNTFVMVCDISYYDRRQTGVFLAALAQSLGAVAGNFTNDQQLKQSYNDLGSAVATASLDIAGFSVNIVSYLYQLEWSDKLRDKMYSQYWVDETTPIAEANQRRAAFDNDRKSFQLEFLGQYNSRAGRTVSDSSTPDLKQVVREVCSNAVDNSINNLAKMFPVFKAKTPFYCDNDQVYAYIGTKEGVSIKSKFEVIEMEKTKKKGIQYNKVGEMRPSYVWDNAGIYIFNDSIEQLYKGTQFQRSSGRKDVCDQGLMLREMGKLGYQYRKRNRFYVGLILGKSSVSDSKMDEAVNDKKLSSHSASGKSCDVMTYGFEGGWILNCHTNLAWNVFNLSMVVGSNGEKRSEGMENVWELGASTGVVLRTSPLGKCGKYALFVWPNIGVAYNQLNVSYTDSYSTTSYRKGGSTTYHSNKKNAQWQGMELGWSVKAGITLSENLLIAAHIGNYHKAVTVAYSF